ncbi:MAG: AI-2E family transporter, partial [Planctomycetota bacterium]
SMGREAEAANSGRPDGSDVRPPSGPPGPGRAGGAEGPREPGAARRTQGPVWFWGLFALVACLVIAGVLVFRPFWDILFVAAVLTTLLHPLYRRILRVVGERRRGIASAATCGVFVFLVLVPVSWFGYRMVLEAGGALRSGARQAAGAIEKAARAEVVAEYLRDHPALEERLSWIRTSLERFASGLEPRVPEEEVEGPELAVSPEEEAAAERPVLLFPSAENLARLATGLAGAVARFLAGAFGLVLKLFLMVFLMFYFFRDGPEILGSLRKQVPLDEESQERVLETFRAVSRSIFRGTLLTALVQGAVATIAYALLGLPAIFWGAFTTLAALLPAVGTGIVTVPIALTFALGGEWTKAAVMAAVAAFVSVLDNILRPILVEGELHLHPVWILLSVLGGVSVFGVLGLVIGPMVVVLLRTLLELLLARERRYDGAYRREET